MRSLLPTNTNTKCGGAGGVIRLVLTVFLFVLLCFDEHEASLAPRTKKSPVAKPAALMKAPPSRGGKRSLLKNELILAEGERGGDEEDENVALLSKKVMDELKLFPGDTVVLRGRRRCETMVVAQPVETEDGADPTAQVSTATRKNLRCRVGDSVKVYEPKMRVKELTSITIRPFEEDLENLSKEDADDLFDAVVAPHFQDAGAARVPLHKGNVVVIKGTPAKSIEFMIEELRTEDDEDAEESETEFGLVTEDTEVNIEEPLSRVDDTRMNEVGYDDVGGCSRQVAEVRELIELPLRHPETFMKVGIPPPRGCLLMGPPGCGKTLLARAAIAETGAHMVMCNGPEIVGKGSGESETNLRSVFEEAEKNAPSIIFIDEIDVLGQKRDKAGGEVEKRLVAMLLTLMDGIKPNSHVVVVAATNRPNVLDPALRRFGRFDRELEIGVPTEQGRLEILQIKTRDMKIAADVDLEQVAKNCHGFVGSDIAQLCMEAALVCIRERMTEIDPETDHLDASLLATLEVTNDHFTKALKSVNPSSLRETLVEVPNVTWQDIGGLEETKRELQEMIKLPIEYADKWKKYGSKSSKGVLFYGPPGCGKTLLAKAVANMCGANFISVKGPELLSMWFGESEANIRELFNKAKAASPCILFFDEMDSIARGRKSGGGGGGSDVGDRVINQILTEIDNVGDQKQVFLIGATNRPDILDSSVTRPGHLDQLIYIPLPDFESRKSILKANLRKSPVSPEVDLDDLAHKTKGLSGADLAEICQRAAMNAIRECVAADLTHELEREAMGADDDDDDDWKNPIDIIRPDHFEEALSRARRSVSEKDIQRYKDFAKALKDDRGFDQFSLDEAAAKKDQDEAEDEDAEEEDLWG